MQPGLLICIFTSDIFSWQGSNFPQCFKTKNIATDKRGIHIIFFLFLDENICCGFSLEAPRQGASNAYPQHKFLSRKKISAFFGWKKAPYLLLCKNIMCFDAKALIFFFRSSHSRSSRSYSPVPKKRKHHSPVRKLKKSKYSPEKYSSKVVHKSHKRKQRSQSPSHSLSPSPEYKSSHKKHYKEKLEKYYSPERHSKKSRNGHHLSPGRDRYDKYEKYDKYDKYEKYRRWW